MHWTYLSTFGDSRVCNFHAIELSEKSASVYEWFCEIFSSLRRDSLKMNGYPDRKVRNIFDFHIKMSFTKDRRNEYELNKSILRHALLFAAQIYPAIPVMWKSRKINKYIVYFTCYKKSRPTYTSIAKLQ